MSFFFQIYKQKTRCFLINLVNQYIADFVNEVENLNLLDPFPSTPQLFTRLFQAAYLCCVDLFLKFHKS